MKPLTTLCLLSVLLFAFSIRSLAQQEDRLLLIENRLNELTVEVPGLNQKTEISVSESSLRDFLQALALSNHININTDPRLTQIVSYHFSNETAKNILLYLVRQYNLDINFSGSILTVIPYIDPLSMLPPPLKNLQIFTDSSHQLITMDLQNDTLANVTRKIALLTNVNLVVYPEVANRLVSGYIQNVTVENALTQLSVANQLKINRTYDNTYSIGALNTGESFIPKQDPITNNTFSIRRSASTSTATGAAPTIDINTENNHKLISLNTTGSSVRDIVKSVSEQAGINYFLYSDLQGTVTANVSNMEYEDVLRKIFLGTPYTFSRENNIYMIGERTFEGLRTQRLIQLKYRSVDSLLYMIPEDYRRSVSIKEFKELNGFVVTGSEPQIKEIESFINQIDKKVPMITIEVIIMDVNKSKTVSTGIRAGVSDSVRTGGTILDGLDYTFGSRDINNFIQRLGLNNVFNIGRVSPNFYVQLSALERNNNVDLRQTPKLSTLNGHSATLSIGNTRYYSVTTQNVIGSLNPSTVVTQQYYPVEANLALDIVPFVSSDENVTMSIGVNISDFTASTPINQPPPTSTSKFRSIIRVKNEEMIVLGGIERTEKSVSGSGIPLLSRIPILKWLFSSRTKSDSKVVSIVFIKPSIVF